MIFRLEIRFIYTGPRIDGTNESRNKCHVSENPPLQRRQKHLEPLDCTWHMAGIVFHTLTWHTDMNM